MATYSTQGKDVLLDGKVVASGVDADAAIRMAQKSATKAGGVFSPTPVNSPQQPTTTPTTPLATTTPATTPPSPQPSTKQYYAVGADLYEAGTNRYIGATEWGRDWTGRATEVEAPTSQTVTTPTTPSEIAQTEAPVYTTGTTRNEQTTTQQQAQQFTNKMQTEFGGSYGIPTVDQSIYTPFSQTQKGVQEEAQLTYAEEALKAVRAGTYTPEQQAQIESAIKATEAAYAPLIREAEQAKAQGLPNAEVLAGQLGGFMNTQFAGLAALIPTEGGNFRGAGGELERIASAYDQNIANAKSASQRAIEEAKSRAISAINTGAREDYDLAVIAYDRAKSAHDESIALSRQKTEDLINWAVKSQELQKFRQETASKTLDTMASAGYEREDIPDWYFEELDKSSGYMPGTSQAMFEVTKNEKAALSAEAELKQTEAMISIMEKIPVGESVTINGVEYTSLNRGDWTSYMEDDGSGNSTLVRLNLDTGESTSETFYGISKVDGWELQTKNGVSAWVNPRTQQIVIANDGSIAGGGKATGGLMDIPNGQYWGECGVFVRNVTGMRIVDPNYAAKGIDPNSFQSKMNVMDPSITAETVEVGDVFVQNAGVWTGHTGIITAKYVIDGEVFFDTKEANWGKDGLVGERKSVPASKFGGFARPGLSPQYQFGTSGTGESDQVSAFLGEDSEVSSQVSGYVDQIVSGKISLTDVPADERGAVAARMDDPDIKQKANESYVSNLKDVLATVEIIKDHPGLENAVGAAGVGRSGFNPGQNADFVSYVESLTSEETINALVNAKARGATFGALSEGELNLLKDSANRINQWAVVDKQTGKVKGYKVDNERFRVALDEVIASTNKILAKIQQADPLIVDDATAAYLKELNY